MRLRVWPVRLHALYLCARMQHMSYALPACMHCVCGRPQSFPGFHTGGSSSKNTLLDRYEYVMHGKVGG